MHGHPDPVALPAPHGGELLPRLTHKPAFPLLGDPGQVRPGKAGEIIQGIAVIGGRFDFLKPRLAGAVQEFLRPLVFLLGIRIHLMDGGTGNNIVELVAQHNFPGLIQRGLLIGIPQHIAQRGNPLRLAQGKFQPAVLLFILGLRGIGSPVKLQIEFPIPNRDLLPGLIGVRMDFFEKLPGGRGLDIGQPGQSCHGAPHLEHIAVGAASAVSKAVGNERILSDILVFKLFPASQHAAGAEHSIVGGKAGSKRMTDFRSIDKIGQNFRSIDSLPAEEIVGHGIIFVPADFRRHKRIDTALAKQLGQRPAVAEHIRQPQGMAAHPELLLKEGDPLQQLAY